MRTARLLAATALTTLLTSGLRAQDTHARRGESAFELGMLSLDVGPLNRRLATLGLPATPERYLVTAASGQIHLGRLLIGGGSQNLGPREVDGTDRSLRVGGQLLMAHLGVDLLSGGGRTLTPVIAAGHQEVRLRFSAEPPTGFDDAATTFRSTDLRAGTWIGYAGLRFEQRVFEAGSARIGLTAQGGYLTPLGGSRWKADDQRLQDAPDVRATGATFRIGLTLAKGKSAQ